MNKQLAGYFLRNLTLFKPLDYIRYLFFKIIKSKKNKNFIKNNPEIILPPDYLMYESFQLDYKKYYDDSIESAREIINKTSNYINFQNANILDWGCGPARIIRHLPLILSDKNCNFFATDYNEKTINWCKSNIKGIEFNHNLLEPGLWYSDNFFDFVYGISIFTHLSAKMHYEWMKELIRITKKGGVIYLTLHGQAFREKLIKKEQKIFDCGNIVVRDKVKEGHRTYVAFHPKDFVYSWLQETGSEILEYNEGDNKGKPQQDIWILRKKNDN